MKKYLAVAATGFLTIGLSSLANASFMTGGDAADQASADAILDIVFVIDTSGSMYDDINNIGAVASTVITNLECATTDCFVRASFMSITYNYGIFDQKVIDLPGTSISNSSEDNAPAVTDLVNNYNWNDDSTATQDYYKAVVTIGDEGTENGYPVSAEDWAAAYVANQIAIANDVMVFGWVTDPYPGVVNVFTAMATGVGTSPYDPSMIFGNTGGSFLNFAGSGDALGAELENIICTAASGGTNEVPEPGTMLLMGTGLAGLIGVRRKKMLKK